ncbi:hypothetical protein [Geminicoccus roseus]|uniref:hypothetical protein n=1 Tax=Geminicoccus roseus TaxID=404900 RepID=UPI0004189763|nr:hypothetical protein [Geminicoccus roseus]
MRLVVLMLATLAISAAALPAMAACPYKEQVAQSDPHAGQDAKTKLPVQQSRG